MSLMNKGLPLLFIFLLLIQTTAVFAESTDDTTSTMNEEVVQFIDMYYKKISSGSYMDLKESLSKEEYDKLILAVQQNASFKLIEYEIVELNTLNENEYLGKINIKITGQDILNYIYIYKEDGQFKLSYDKFLDKAIENYTLFAEEQNILNLMSLIKNGDWSYIPLSLIHEKDELNKYYVDFYTDTQIKETLAKGAESEEYKNLRKSMFYSKYLDLYESPYLVSTKVDGGNNTKVTKLKEYIKNNQVELELGDTFVYSFSKNIITPGNEVAFSYVDNYYSILQGSLDVDFDYDKIVDGDDTEDEDSAGGAILFVFFIVFVMGMSAMLISSSLY